MKKLGTAIAFFTIGLAFVAALWFLKSPDCNELCPDWFTGYLLLYYALPLVWFATGWLKSNKPLTTGLALAVLNCIALIGVIKGVHHFVV